MTREITATANANSPRAEAHRLLVEARDLITVSLDAVNGDKDSQRAAELVGRSSDRIGQALYHMRVLLQHR